MTQPTHSTSDIPVQVFEAVLKALSEKGMAAEKVAALRKVLIEDRNFSEAALRAAVLSEENVP